MTFLDTLTEKEKNFFDNLTPNNIINISEIKYSEIKEMVKVYREFWQFRILHSTTQETLENLIRNIANYNGVYFPLEEGFKGTHKFNFSNNHEALLFITLVIDPYFKIAYKFLEFLEQTNSKAKALILYKQYTQKYNSFFDAKILQTELLIIELERKFNTKRKRTINK